MDIFNMTKSKMQDNNSIFTLTEIFQQPKTWLKTLEQIKKNKDEIKNFINTITSKNDYDIILTGAGTSEFIGNSLYPYLNVSLNHKVKSYATTDIVSSPEIYLSKNKFTLLISFGRSGNSPESIGAVEAANTICDNIYHLFITCNKEGSLSKMSNNLPNCYAINLTEETHDKSFAMTSSFSNMYLAAYLCFNLDILDKKTDIINNIVLSTENFLNKEYKIADNLINKYNFKRIVYLGSNSLKGISQESSLKMLELTSGKISPLFDTPLGFRHGPKSIINDSTLVVLYVNSNSFTYKYELDLIKELSSQRKGDKLAIISYKDIDELKKLCDFYYSYNLNIDVNNVEIGLAYITFAQILSAFKSLSMGISPDNPCPSGEVNRVVKGVTLYNYNYK